MKKHNSDSHVGFDGLDDDDIDYVVQLKLMVAEAQSEADAAGVHIATLTKQNQHLQQINAHLQDRVISGSSRMAALESELQAYKQSARRRSASNADAGGGGGGGDACNNWPPAVTTIAGPDLALSDLRFRVAELERQNKMLRSKLKDRKG